ncbi:MAG: hypothetical protein J7L11_04435, partial [Thermoprotei archaeon]|nr:hypothetical protein [Thermoprotei archaeon]
PLYLMKARFYAMHPFAVRLRATSGVEYVSLMYRLLGWLYLTGADMVLLMKIIPPLMYGLVGLCFHLFLRSCEGFSEGESLVAVLILALSPPHLRVSWDMHKQVLSTIFMFSALISLRLKEDRMRWPLFCLFYVLCALSHELVFSILSLLVFLSLLARFRSSSKLALVLYLSSLFVGLFLLLSWYGWDVRGMLSLALTDYYHDEYYYAYGDVWWFVLVERTFAPFLLLFWPLLPLALLGFRASLLLTSWLSFCFFCAFFRVVFPFLAPSLSWRWMLLSVYPLSAYAAKGLTRALGSGNVHVRACSLAMLSSLLFLSLDFLGVLGLRVYAFKNGYSIIPPDMLSSSLSIEGFRATEDCVHWLNEHACDGSVLLVDSFHHGWARFLSEVPVITFGPLYRSRPDLLHVEDAVELALSLGYKRIYLLASSDARERFNLIYVSVFGPEKIYVFVVPG